MAVAAIDGNFAPATDGGKVFLMVFALVGIPIIGTAVGILAAVVLNGLEFIAVMHMDELELAFKHFDTVRRQRGGWLSHPSRQRC